MHGWMDEQSAPVTQYLTAGRGLPLPHVCSAGRKEGQVALIRPSVALPCAWANNGSKPDWLPVRDSYIACILLLGTGSWAG